MTNTTLTEREIRPPELMSRQHIAALTDVGRMLSRCGEFVMVDCPACASPDARPRFSKNSIEYVECRSCGTLYVNPRPSREVLEWFYRGSPNYAYWNDVIFPASEKARHAKIFVPRVDRVIELCDKYAVARDALLEVGAGFGTFCAEIESRHAFGRVTALEPTPDLARTCRERGLDVLELPVEALGPHHARSFDVVASFEVIEHLFSPREFVRHAAGLLRPGGLFIVTCPNGRGFDIATLGPASNSVDHEHLNYFNPQSLSRLLRDGGLQVLESLTPGRLDAELVRNKILSADFDVSQQPFLKEVLLDDWERLGEPFQQFLVDHGLSSNLWLVARRLP